MEITEYNPDKDPGGSGAKVLVDLLVTALAGRLEAQAAPPMESAVEAAPTAPSAPEKSEGASSSGTS